MTYNDISNLFKLHKCNVERYKVCSFNKEFTKKESIDFK